MRKKVVLFILLCIFITGCGNNNSSDMMENNVNNIEKIEVNEVKKISEDYKETSDIRIVDVRTSDEYAEGHIKNAINIPLAEIENIDISKEIEIIVYCKSGSRSYNAALKLKDLGYNVKDMGGLNNWDYELEK